MRTPEGRTPEGQTPQARGRGLYVHVPFCARACPYCDFDFEVGRRPAIDRYFAGLAREWEVRSLDPGFSTVYVGGGTPSMLGAAGLGTLMAWIGARLPVRPAEWTVELNPEHVDDACVEAVTRGGADRVSLGVQTWDSEGLRALGRVHDPAGASAAVRRVRAAGLRVSVDLIVGWPGQSLASLGRDVETVRDLGVAHVSIYALTIEPGTPWTKLVRRGLRRMPDEGAQTEALTTAAARLEAAGFEHYEVASYGRGAERARHNLGYWQFRDYVGLGPSAASASFDRGRVHRRTNVRSLAAWSQDPGAATTEDLGGEHAAAEGLWVGLRHLQGIALDGADGFLATFPQVDRRWVERRVATQVLRGNLEWKDDGRLLRLTTEGWLWHDAVGAAIVEP